MELLKEIVSDIYFDLIHEIKIEAYKNKNWQNIISYCDAISSIFCEIDFDYCYAIYAYLIRISHKLTNNEEIELVLKSILMSDIEYVDGKYFPVNCKYYKQKNDSTYYVKITDITTYYIH